MTDNQTADFKILADGTWIHDGAPIKREALVKLFSDRALSIDGEGRYWLKTPYEQHPVMVEDVPFVITDYRYEDGALTLFSNLGETVEVGPDFPIILKHAKHFDMELPYIEIRDGLLARFGRSVYYNMSEEFGLSVTSQGVEFSLGTIDETE